MSLVSRLWDEDYDMKCWCTACGKYVDVYEDDLNCVLPDFQPEHEVVCSECGQSFYVSEDYD